MSRVVVLAFASLTLMACEGLLGIRQLEVTEDQDRTELEPEEPKLASSEPEPKAPITMPDGGRDAGHKRVFVTSASFSGNLGGLEGANQKCKDVAAGASLDGEWVAWISGDGKKAIDTLTFEGPYQLLDGTEIAANKEALVAGSLPVPINVTEGGQTIPGGDLVGVWTGTRANGDIGETCSKWTDANPFNVGTAADPKRKDGAWTDMGGTIIIGNPKGYACSLGGRLYCFER